MDGFLLIDKPKGYTSREICNIVSKTFKTKKVGHVGTLDPFATGLLLVTINKGTKAGAFFDDSDKEYEANLVLGKETETGDIEGKITKTCPLKEFREEEILKAFKSLTGKILQTPPMTSAIHINGTKLYELARKGIEIERPSREIEIYSLNLLEHNQEHIRFKAHVSKGTYIRVLGEDIAKKLNTVGHLNELRRLKIGPFNVEDAISIEDISEDKIVPVSDILSQIMPTKIVDESLALDIKNGKVKYLEEDTKFEKLLIIDDNNKTIAVYIKNEDGKLEFRRGLF